MNRAPPLEHGAALFLRESGEEWSGGRLLRLAANVDTALARGGVGEGQVVGVSSSSAAYVAAAVLALWTRGAEPLVLDPLLRREPDVVLRGHPGMVVLADSPREAMAGAVVVPAMEADISCAPLVPRWPEADRAAALFLTSGSTGEPKVIRKQGYQLFGQMEQELEVLGVRKGVSVYSLAPPYHILGFVYGLFLPLLGRGTAAFSPGELQGIWCDHIRQARPGLVVGVPMHYRLLARYAEEPLPKAVYFSSGAPLPPSVNKTFLERAGHPIFQGYGSTETGGIARRQGLSAWIPFPGLQWRIEPEGGRLAVRSPWQEEPGRWHVTDDVAERSGDGFRLLGRADSVVKVAGKRFSTDEVVRAAQSMEGVDQAAAVTYERFGEIAVALFVVPAGGAALDEAELRAWLGRSLATFKIPRTVRALSDLPRLGSGKVDRPALRELCLTRRK